MKTKLAQLLPLLALTACVDNNASVYVAAICVPPAQAETCEFGSTCDAQYLGYNTLDVAAANTLWLIVEVHNQTLNTENANRFKTNTSDAFVHEYEVEYLGAAVSLARGTVPGSARIPAEGTSVISVPVVNEAARAELAALVGAGARIDLVGKLRLKGVYGDTTEFKTGDFDVPIRACNGCFTGLACTAPAVPVYCPQAGQLPASASCFTP